MHPEQLPNLLVIESRRLGWDSLKADGMLALICRESMEDMVDFYIALLRLYPQHCLHFGALSLWSSSNVDLLHFNEIYVTATKFHRSRLV